jgi:hypothetical protein
MLVLRRLAALAAAAALTVSAPQAKANGRFPAANQLVVAPTQPSRLVLRTTFGLLVSEDGGKNFDWICEKSVGYGINGGSIEDPAIAITGSGAVIAGLFVGLSRSPDTCTWSMAERPIQGRFIIDVAVRRSQPNVAVAVTSVPVADGGTTSFENRIFRTVDDGVTWNQVGPPLDPTLLVETIDLTDADPGRVYVSGVRDRSGQSLGVLLVSSDEGQSWVERAVPLDSEERAPFIAAVDPNDASRVYVRNSGLGHNRLLLSEDAGQTFRVVFTSQGPLLGFALSPDGSKIFVGGPKDGLYAAQRSAMQFEKKSETAVQCLAASGRTLWACSAMTAGFILGRSDDDGSTFAAALSLDGVRGPVACAAGTGTAACQADWPRLRDQLAGGDAGNRPSSTPDHGDGADHGSDPGCAISASPPALGVAPCIWALLALWHRRRLRALRRAGRRSPWR